MGAQKSVPRASSDIGFQGIDRKTRGELEAIRSRVRADFAAIYEHLLGPVRPKLLSRSDDGQYHGYGNPWLLLERRDKPGAGTVLARVITAQSDVHLSRLDSFRFHFIDDGMIQESVMTWTRNSWTVFGIASYERVSRAMGQFNLPPQGVLALTAASWKETLWAMTVAGANGAPYIAWIAHFLGVPHLAAIILSFLALPRKDGTFTRASAE
jgi:hypothetical protein